MGARDLPQALTLAVALALAATAQDSGLPPPEERLLERAQAAERFDAFLRAWDESDDEQRAAVVSELAEHERFASELDPWPAPRELARWTRLLRNDPVDEWTALVDSLALRLVPGVVELPADVSADGVEPRARDPLRVVIYRRWEVPVPDQARLAILFQPPGRAPDAAEPQRDKPFADGWFAAGRDAWILRVPPPVPGTWSVVPEVRGPGGSFRGVPATLEVRTSAADGELDPADVERLRRFGVRVPRGAHTSRPSSSLPAQLRPGTFRSPQIPEDGARPLVVVVARDGQRPEELFFGFRGERWANLSDALGIDVVSIALEEARGARLGATLAALRAPAPDRFVALVARGRASALLPIAFARSPDARVDALFLSGSTRPSPVLPAVPTFVWRPERRRAVDEWELPTDTPHVRVENGAAHAFLGELDLPATLGEWLAELLRDGSR